MLDAHAPHSRPVHLFRLATAESEGATKVERDIHVLRLFNHEHVLAPCGMVPSTLANVGVVFDLLPHELSDALAGRPALTVTEETAALVAIALGLEFLGARRLYFSQMKMADVGLTATHVAKVRCFGLAAAKDNEQEAAVVAAYGGLMKEVLDASSHFKDDCLLGNVANRCIQGSVRSLCELTLDMQQVCE